MFQSRWLSVGPTVVRRKNRLTATTGGGLWAATLGLCDRRVVVDADRRVVRVRDRVGWFWERGDKYPFDLIRAVTFGYGFLSPDGWTLWARDGYESYRVGLRLHGSAGDRVHLFRHTGPARFSNTGPLPNWVYWQENLTDVVGTQEEEAQSLVTVLGWMIGVPIERE